MPSPIKASGYIVYNDIAIWSVGVSERDAWANAIIFLHGQPNAETVQKYNVDGFSDGEATQEHIDMVDDRGGAIGRNEFDGFSDGEATQELIDMVNELGGAIGWSEVDGIHCTEKQKQEYEDSLLKQTI